MALAVVSMCATPWQSQAESGGWTNYIPGGEWILRAGAGIADPQADNAFSDGLEIELDDDTQFVGDLTYMFNRNWGVELFGSSPFAHEAVARDGTGDIGGTGEIEYIPWTLSLQYHFLPESFVRPYLGVGGTFGLITGDEPPEVDFDDEFGFGGGAGIDFGQPDGDWLVNVAVKYIDLGFDYEGPDAALDGESIDIDPLIYSLSVGYRFGREEPAPAPVVAPPPPPPPPPPPAPAKCADGDMDGVCDEMDKCPNTPAGTKVDKAGCPLEQTLKLLFDFDSAELRPESLTELERVVTFMNDVPFATALIEGHTDSVGSAAYNLKLSDRRAKAVYDYLTSRGVDPARLSSIGKGLTAPIADNATAEGRQLNRRVMLIRTDSGM